MWSEKIDCASNITIAEHFNQKRINLNITIDKLFMNARNAMICIKFELKPNLSRMNFHKSIGKNHSTQPFIDQGFP